MLGVRWKGQINTCKVATWVVFVLAISLCVHWIVGPRGGGEGGGVTFYIRHSTDVRAE